MRACVCVHACVRASVYVSELECVRACLSKRVCQPTSVSDSVRSRVR